MNVFLEHPLLSGIMLASGSLFLWTSFAPLRYGRGLSTMETVQWMNHRRPLLLDIRDASAFSAGHLARAKSVEPGTVAQQVALFPSFRDKPVIVCCQTGARSAAFAAALKKHGFSEATYLKGGIAAWLRAELPLEKT